MATVKMENRYYFKTRNEAEKFIDKASEIAGELTDANLKAAFPDLVLDREADSEYTVKVIFGDHGTTFVMHEKHSNVCSVSIKRT